jgi:hypothetical protein
LRPATGAAFGLLLVGAGRFAVVVLTSGFFTAAGFFGSASATFGFTMAGLGATAVGSPAT